MGGAKKNSRAPGRPHTLSMRRGKRRSYGKRGGDYVSKAREKRSGARGIWGRTAGGNHTADEVDALTACSRFSLDRRAVEFQSGERSPFKAGLDFCHTPTARPANDSIRRCLYEDRRGQKPETAGWAPAQVVSYPQNRFRSVVHEKSRRHLCAGGFFACGGLRRARLA